VVQKTTELGVARIVPIVTERSVARPEPRHRARWEKIAREAARQCGRADVPRVDEPAALAVAVGAPDLPATRFALWEGERRRALRVALAVAYGAEARGGSTRHGAARRSGGRLPARGARAGRRAGFVPVSLGPRVLRVETAAITAVALVQAAAGGLD